MGVICLLLKIFFEDLWIIGVWFTATVAIISINLEVKKVRLSILILLFSWLFSLVGAFLGTFPPIHNLSYLLFSISAAIMALTLVNANEKSLKQSANIILLFILAFGIFIYLKHPAGFRDGVVTDHGSVNLITGVIIFVLAFHHLITRNKPVLILGTIVLFSLAVVGDSRSAMICAFLLMSTIFISRRNHLQLLLSGVLICSLPLIAFLLPWNAEELQLSLFGASRLYELGLETVRIQLWSQWAAHLTLETFFFGVSLSDVPIIKYYGENPHNSLIYLHSRFGIFAIILVMIFLGYYIAYFRSDVIGFILLSIIILRSMTDTLLFIMPLDFFLYFFIFFWHTKRFSIPRQLNSEN